MRTYDTAFLKKLAPESTLPLSVAARVTGIHVSELCRQAKAGHIRTRAVIGRVKEELVAGDLLELVKRKNQKSHLANVRRMAKTEPKMPREFQMLCEETNPVVVGVFEQALEKKPHWVVIPDGADTIGDLLDIATASIGKTLPEARELADWVAYLETL